MDHKAPLTKEEEKHARRLLDAQHAMQSGVLFVLTNQDFDLLAHESSPKHLRVGVNTAMSEVGALARLLMEKGVFTREEYFKALADAMEEEQKTYEDKTGSKFA